MTQTTIAGVPGLERVKSSPLPLPPRSLSRTNSLFSRTEPTLSGKGSRTSVSIHQARLVQTFRDAGLTASEGRSVRRFLSCLSPEDVRFGVLTAAKHEPPDVYLLRYLRRCRWEVNKALVLLLNSLIWRLKEMKVDNVLLPRGELYAAQQEQNLMDKHRSEEARGFISQLRMGKCYVYGVDRLNQPVCVVRVRLHQPGAQSKDALNQFITHIYESVRLVISPPIETATVVFDMTGFSLANMEYAPVKFIIRCFETYYPESLGVLLLHNAPRIFAGIWRVIKGWMDPALAAKVHFTRTIKDLEQFIALDQIASELGSSEDWEYEYPEPEPDENRQMEDYATRDTLLAERQSIAEQFLAATSRWISATGSQDEEELKQAILRREEIVEQISANYWDLDPHVRARNFLDRTAMIHDGGRIENYPATPKTPPQVQIQTAKILQVRHVQRARLKIVTI
ncbi:hypothetical protein ARAM_000198 [Aspergillus rambellii]|uniref:CRAL-TRIO domain-containing protein n=1 Tax=Aspergillus rambellii TaxID=308745 RepID=A0A0F8U302_9EURO|nr:hypothetical protein ARAM_000198 [Aspergillus rambellii]